MSIEFIETVYYLDTAFPVASEEASTPKLITMDEIEDDDAT